MKSIILFGPFIGSLKWEFYNFAPYVIYTKKTFPEYKIAVLTRQSRFDLYGRNVDFLIPLDIENDNVRNQICFKLKDFNIEQYKKLIEKFYNVYKERFNILNHIYPNINNYRYKLRWQFDRSKMDYDFQPRKNNIININSKFKKNKFILLLPPYNDELINELYLFMKNNNLNKKYSIITYDFYDDKYINIDMLPYNINVSKIGYLIEIIKRSIFTIGSKSDYVYLSLLLKRKVLLYNGIINNNRDNPFETDIEYIDKYINNKSIYNIWKLYENNI